MIGLRELKWSGHVVRMENDKRPPEYSGKLKHIGRDPKEDLDTLGKNGYRIFGGKRT
jgi:hypothetical protein